MAKDNLSNNSDSGDKTTVHIGDVPATTPSQILGPKVVNSTQPQKITHTVSPSPSNESLSPQPVQPVTSSPEPIPQPALSSSASAPVATNNPVEAAAIPEPARPGSIPMASEYKPNPVDLRKLGTISTISSASEHPQPARVLGTSNISSGSGVQGVSASSAQSTGVPFKVNQGDGLTNIINQITGLGAKESYAIYKHLEADFAQLEGVYVMPGGGLGIRLQPTGTLSVPRALVNKVTQVAGQGSDSDNVINQTRPAEEIVQASGSDDASRWENRSTGLDTRGNSVYGMDMFAENTDDLMSGR